MRRLDLILALVLTFIAASSTLFLYNQIKSRPTPGLILLRNLPKKVTTLAIIRGNYCVGRLNFGTTPIESGGVYGDSYSRLFLSANNQPFSLGSRITFQLNPLGQLVEGTVKIVRDASSITATLSDVNPIRITFSSIGFDWPAALPTEFSIPGPLALRDRGTSFDLEYARFSPRTAEQIMNQVRKNPAFDQLVAELVGDTRLVAEDQECAGYPQQNLALSEEFANESILKLLVTLTDQPWGVPQQ